MLALAATLELHSQVHKETFASGLVVNKRFYNQQLVDSAQVLEGRSRPERTCEMLSYSLT